jgi:2-polyprenyl-3-methyl-5-hydroxy-6-metoxy-1,4-benzoquinol methylase
MNTNLSNNKTEECPLCHTNFTKLITNKLRRGNGKVLFCEKCKHGFLIPEKQIIDVKKYYSDEYRTEFSHKAAGDATNAQELFDVYKKFQSYRLPHIEPYLNSAQSLLEIGASAGQFIFHIANKVKEVNAIELDTDCTDFMKNKLKINADSEFLNNSKFSTKKYDIICSFQVLEHVESPVSFLTDIKNRMNENAMAFIEVPNLNDGLLSVWKLNSYSEFYYHSAHLHYFTKQSLLKVALEAGFQAQNISFIFLQDYNVLNHLHWITSNSPQSTCEIGLNNISLGSNQNEITSWLNNEICKVNKEYIQKLIECEATSNVMMILKNTK